MKQFLLRLFAAKSKPRCFNLVLAGGPGNPRCEQCRFAKGHYGTCSDGLYRAKNGRIL